MKELPANDPKRNYESPLIELGSNPFCVENGIMRVTLTDMGKDLSGHNLVGQHITWNLEGCQIEKGDRFKLQFGLKWKNGYRIRPKDAFSTEPRNHGEKIECLILE